MSSKAKNASSAKGCCVSSDESNKEENDSKCCRSQRTSTVLNNAQVGKRRLDIDFMYLDLNICTRCQGADLSLEEALVDVSNVLEATGVQVFVHKIHVESEEQAAEIGFVVSPTIRVNGQDIQMNFRESLCKSCGTLCDCEEGVLCREWEYQGQWYAVPPKGLIIEAILKEVYGDAEKKRKISHGGERVPDNLKRFFDSARNAE